MSTNEHLNECLILGIESSCDETAAAIVAGGRRILSSVVASQTEIHRKYGGVVPELASREHLRQIVPVVREAVEQARVTMKDLDAVAVTHGPGLVGALLEETFQLRRPIEVILDRTFVPTGNEDHMLDT